MPIHRRVLLTQLLASVSSITLLGEASAQDVTYAYDALGRVIRVTNPNGSTITYTYDAAGNRTQVVQAAGTGQPIGAFYPSLSSIPLGASVTLYWTSLNATSASIDNGVGAVTPVAGGSVSVSPSVATTYTLTLTGAGGSTVLQTTIAVRPGGTFSASPSGIPPGNSATLSWTSAGATAASIDNGVGAVTPVAGGSVAVSPTVTTTYTLTLDGTGGQTVLQTTLIVAPLPTGTFVAAAPTIGTGGSTTLTWTSQNATSASIDHGVGSVTPVAGGSVIVSPTTTTTYTLTLNSLVGPQTLQATVTVNPDFNQTIAITGAGPVNLRTLAQTAGYDGLRNAIITFQLGSGVTISGASGGGIGLDTGLWPSNGFAIALTLQVSGNLYGGGGTGGTGSDMNVYVAGSGGDAVFCRENIAVTINAGGQAKAGGGGAGGGGGWRFRDSEGEWQTSRQGGGGGGGFPNGAGGAGVNSGNAATTFGGGAGGAGSTGGGRLSGAGGTGGNAAAGGGDGAVATGTETAVFEKTIPGIAGGAGYAIRKNGKTVTVTNNGTISGTVG
ncbi:MAG: RHS repeat protein [Hyphomonadaceae bacterium]|nr:RHS repeat protein [Hyphomonadaceae bacterium]